MGLFEGGKGWVMEDVGWSQWKSQRNVARRSWVVDYLVHKQTSTTANNTSAVDRVNKGIDLKLETTVRRGERWEKVGSKK